MSYERPEEKTEVHIGYERPEEKTEVHMGYERPEEKTEVHMGYERPEDKWKREKQYPQQNPGQPGQPPVNPADEQRWMEENNGRTVVHLPGQPGPNQPPPNPQEQQWLREKQGQAMPPNPGYQQQQWLREKQGQPPMSPQQQQWLREKQGQAQPPNPGYQQQQWLREKQGQPAPTFTQPAPGPYRPMSPQEQQWIRDKQGQAPVVTLPPPLPVKKSRVGLYVGLGIGIVILVAAIAVLAIIILSPKPGPTPTPVNAAGTTPTVAATGTTVAPTTAAPVTTAAPTTAPVTTVAPTTAVATTSAPVVVTTTAASSDSARLVSLAEEAAKNSRWEDVIQSLEQLSSSDPNYSKAKPLLVKAYFESGQQEVAKGTNTQDSANKALNFYRKASAIDPNYAGLGDALRRADTYAKGLLQYESEQYAQVVATIRPLYDEGELQSEGVHYRNTGDLLYNSYIKLGDATFDVNSQEQLLKSRTQYSLAVALDVVNKDLANQKLQQADRAFKLLGPTPTPVKK